MLTHALREMQYQRFAYSYQYQFNIQRQFARLIRRDVSSETQSPARRVKYKTTVRISLLSRLVRLDIEPNPGSGVNGRNDLISRVIRQQTES